MRNKKIIIKIWKEKETKLYVASIDHFDGKNYATQGKTMKELYKMISDLLFFILNNPKEIKEGEND